MKIIKLIGTGVEDHVVEMSLQKLGFMFTGESALVNASNVKINVNRISKEGKSTNIIPNMTLLQLLEIGAQSEGFARLKGDEAIGTIDLSEFGTIKLGGDYLTLTVTGLVVGQQLEIFAIEGDSFTNVITVWEPNVILAETPKTLNVADADGIVLPSTALVDITLYFDDGRSVSYSNAELRMIMDDINDIVFFQEEANQNIGGFHKLFCLGVENVYEVKMNYTAQTKMFIQMSIV